MELTNIKVHWYHGYANKPEFEVDVDERLPHDAFIYDRYTTDGSDAYGFLLSTNNWPWVRFVQVVDPEGSPTTHGALGGTYRLRGGGVLKTRTGWSSNEGWVNRQKDLQRYRLPGHVIDLVVHEPGQMSGWAGYFYSVDDLRASNLPEGIFIVKDGDFYYPSTDQNEVKKPDPDSNLDVSTRYHRPMTTSYYR